MFCQIAVETNTFIYVFFNAEGSHTASIFDTPQLTFVNMYPLLLML